MFAASAAQLLEDPSLAARLGRAARRLAVERYSWTAAAGALDEFLSPSSYEGARNSMQSMSSG